MPVEGHARDWLIDSFVHAESSVCVTYGFGAGVLKLPANDIERKKKLC